MKKFTLITILSLFAFLTNAQELVCPAIDPGYVRKLPNVLNYNPTLPAYSMNDNYYGYSSVNLYGGYSKFIIDSLFSYNNRYYYGGYGYWGWYYNGNNGGRLKSDYDNTWIENVWIKDSTQLMGTTIKFPNPTSIVRGGTINLPRRDSLKNVGRVLMKTEDNGKPLWYKIVEWSYEKYGVNGGYYYSWGQGMKTDKDGNIYLSFFFYDSIKFDGVKYNAVDTATNTLFLKLNYKGDVVKSKIIGGWRWNDFLYVDNDLNKYYSAIFNTPKTINGKSYQPIGAGDIVLMKTDENDNILWDLHLGEAGYYVFSQTILDNERDLVVDEQGNVYYLFGTNAPSINVGSYTITRSNTDPDKFMTFAVKINKQGQLQWAKKITEKADRIVNTGFFTDKNEDIYLTFNYGASTTSIAKDTFIYGNNQEVIYDKSGVLGSIIKYNPSGNQFTGLHIKENAYFQSVKYNKAKNWIVMNGLFVGEFKIKDKKIRPAPATSTCSFLGAISIYEMDKPNEIEKDAAWLIGTRSVYGTDMPLPTVSDLRIDDKGNAYVTAKIFNIFLGGGKYFKRNIYMELDYKKWNFDTSEVATLMMREEIRLTDLNPAFGYTPRELMAIQDSVKYQWLDCNNSMSPIPGATEKFFRPNNPKGKYALQVSNSWCTLTSDCASGIDEETALQVVQVYPNPVNDGLYIKYLPETATVQVYDVLGRSVFKEQNNKTELKINTSMWASGIYLVQINCNGKYFTKKIIRQEK